MTTAAARALRWLLAAQDDDGCWWDYELPVGRSTQWVTALTGACLAHPCVTQCFPDAMPAAVNAAHALLSRRTYASGWGYNETTGPDADSTAHALLLLRRTGVDAPSSDTASDTASDTEFLLRHWRGEGFATFERDDGWGIAHPDVTALVLAALPADVRDAHERPFIGWLERWREAEMGLWPAYWWHSSFYTAFAVSELFRDRADSVDWTRLVPFGQRVEYTSLLDLVLALGFLGNLPGTPESLAGPLLRRLVAAQQSDASWPGSRILRVTDPGCHEPWNDPRGQLYEDCARVVTTALAVRVLSQWRLRAPGLLDHPQ